MEEQLVTLETALLAKEKGFDIPTVWGVSEEGVISGKITHGNHGSFVDWVKYDRDLKLPSQSLLQKWLRENSQGRVLVEVFSIDDWDNFSARVYGEDCMSPFFEVFTSNEYETYEEALEVGLQEALKLLPQSNHCQ